MWEWLNETLCTFRNCFKREAAFRWFVVIIIGFMMTTDYIGITSFIRELGIAPHYYETILHFFRAKSWNLKDVRQQWLRIVKTSTTIFYEDCSPILIGNSQTQRIIYKLPNSIHAEAPSKCMEKRNQYPIYAKICFGVI